MMPEWHQLDSSCTMSEQQESVKKKTLKSSSRSFLFSTGLFVFGAQKNRLMGRVLLNTHNMSWLRNKKKIILIMQS